MALPAKAGLPCERSPLALFKGVSAALPSCLTPTKTYYLDAAHTDGVTATWNLFFRNFRLDYQSLELGRLTPAELKAGREFALPDGRRLLVRLQQKFGAQGLDFQLDGRPLGGTVNDLLTQLNGGFAATITRKIGAWSG